jgi:diacylglycerol O-acyltransferase / wax synthase
LTTEVNMVEQADVPTPPSAWGSEPVMSDLEALMWRSEASPRLRSTGVFVDVLDRAPEWERLVAAHEWAVQYVPRLRQRVEDDPLRIGTPAWRLDEDFDLGYHLRRAHAPAPGTFAGTLEMAQVLAMAPFDRARPLWEAVLVEGLQDGTSVYLLKLHHSLLDGQAGVQLFDLLHSDRPETTPAKPEGIARLQQRSPHRDGGPRRPSTARRSASGRGPAAWRTDRRRRRAGLRRRA